MLELRAAESGYGETRVLHGVDLNAPKGRVHALLGRNGAGKSTTLKAVTGHLPVTAGAVMLRGEDVTNTPPHIMARKGCAYAPETRDIFGSLTVRENLALAARLAGPDSAWPVERIIELFPNLGVRLSNGGHELSGGEQQMLAIGRALAANPDVVLLDEPTEGLAPVIIQQIFEKLGELKSAGLTVLLVEQNLNFALGLADEVSLMSRGRIVWRGTADELRADGEAQARWLGV